MFPFAQTQARPVPGSRFRPRRGPWAVRIFLLAVLGGFAAALTPAGVVLGHGGDLDEYGGHFDERTGGYHYHRPRWDLAKRTREYLNWGETGKGGELIGVVAEVERPDAIWVEIPYRPAFQNLAPHVSKQNRDDEHARVRVWFRFISPERSVGAHGREYAEWFHQKVVYELDRKLRGQQVTVQFEIAPASNRVQGMVLLGEENVNLWLVLNGWSFNPLNLADNPYQSAFEEAEASAKAKRVGLWSR